MLKNFYDKLAFELEVLYTHAACHSDMGDVKEYQKCLSKMVSIAEILGVDTTQTIIHINFKEERTEDND